MKIEFYFNWQPSTAAGSLREDSINEFFAKMIKGLYLPANCIAPVENKDHKNNAQIPLRSWAFTYDDPRAAFTQKNEIKTYSAFHSTEKNTTLFYEEKVIVEISVFNNGRPLLKLHEEELDKCIKKRQSEYNIRESNLQTWENDYAVLQTKEQPTTSLVEKLESLSTEGKETQQEFLLFYFEKMLVTNSFYPWLATPSGRTAFPNLLRYLAPERRWNWLLMYDKGINHFKHILQTPQDLIAHLPGLAPEKQRLLLGEYDYIMDMHGIREIDSTTRLNKAQRTQLIPDANTLLEVYRALEPEEVLYLQDLLKRDGRFDPKNKKIYIFNDETCAGLSPDYFAQLLRHFPIKERLKPISSHGFLDDGVINILFNGPKDNQSPSWSLVGNLNSVESFHAIQWTLAFAYSLPPSRIDSKLIEFIIKIYESQRHPQLFTKKILEHISLYQTQLNDLLSQRGQEDIVRCALNACCEALSKINNKQREKQHRDLLNEIYQKEFTHSAKKPDLYAWTKNALSQIPEALTCTSEGELRNVLSSDLFASKDAELNSPPQVNPTSSLSENTVSSIEQIENQINQSNITTENGPITPSSPFVEPIPAAPRRTLQDVLYAIQQRMQENSAYPFKNTLTQITHAIALMHEDPLWRTYEESLLEMVTICEQGIDTPFGLDQARRLHSLMSELPPLRTRFFKMTLYVIGAFVIVLGLMALFPMAGSNLLFVLLQGIHLNSIVTTIQALAAATFGTGSAALCTALVGNISGCALILWNKTQNKTPIETLPDNIDRFIDQRLPDHIEMYMGQRRP